MYTENGALSLSTAGSSCVNLFFKTVRDLETDLLFKYCEDAWNENPIDTLKIFLYVRDCQKGKGEKKIFYNMLTWLWLNDKRDTLYEMIDIINDEKLYFGYWKDLLNILVDIKSYHDDIKRTKIYGLIVHKFVKKLSSDYSLLRQTTIYERVMGIFMTKPEKSISLCAKYAPTKNGHHDKILNITNDIARGWFNKEHKYQTRYRKSIHLMREHLNIPEIKFSENKWNELEFEKIPSMCLQRNKKSFRTHCEDKWNEYLEKVKSGEKDMKVKMLYPYEILKPYIDDNDYDEQIEQAWKKKVNEIQKLNKRIIPLCDVSGSMFGDLAIYNSVSLSLLISELVTGPMNNHVITFNDEPNLVKIEGETLYKRVNKIKEIPWGYNTNFKKVFEMLLTNMKLFNVKKEDAPEVVLCLSDMQFDKANNSQTNHEYIKELYEKAGYELPQIWYWNLRANTLDFPVNSNEPNVTMVSGFSKSIIDLLLKSEEITPYKVMKMAIDDKRYDCINNIKSI